MVVANLAQLPHSRLFWSLVLYLFRVFILVSHLLAAGTEPSNTRKS